MILKEIDEVNALRTAEKKGEIRGKIEGKMEGKMEEKIKIAKNSLKQNLDIKTISLITGLTAEEIEDIKI
jgi:predicted transposase YdaD